MRIRKKAWALPELGECSFYIESPQIQRSNWKSIFAEPKLSIHLDLGCGKCVFLAEIAETQREHNFVGVDISYDILGVGRRNIVEVFDKESPKNVCITYHNIEMLSEIFAPQDNIERIYINFCNPWPKARAHKRRLTHTNQLKIYHTLLVPGGEIWFKTDNDDLYLGSLRYLEEAGFEIVFQTEDLHQSKLADENIITEHEQIFTSQGIKIKAIHARKVLA